MSRRMPLILRALLWLLALGLVAWLGLKAKTFLERPPLVEVVEARRESVTRVLAVTGRIRPKLENRILPLVAGRLVELAKEEGENVRRGEVLARVDDRAARAALAQNRAEISREEERLAQGERDLARAESLASSGLIAAGSLEESRLAVVESRRRIEALGEAGRELTVRLDDYVLRSPLEGTVLERPVDPGQTVGTTDVLYELASGSALEIEAEVDERYLPELTLGMAATAAPLAGRREPWNAEINYIGNSIDRLSGAVLVRLAFLDTPPELPSGLSLDLNLIVEEHEQAITLPREAVAGLGAEAWVLRIAKLTGSEDDRQGAEAEQNSEEQVAERVSVRVIDWPAPRLVALAGVEEGDLLIPEPKQATAGQPVRLRREPSREP